MKQVFIADTETEEGFKKNAEKDYLMNPYFMMCLDYNLMIDYSEKPYDKEKRDESFKPVLFFRNALRTIEDSEVSQRILPNKFDKKNKTDFSKYEIDSKIKNFFLRFKDILPCYKLFDKNTYKVDLVAEFFEMMCNFKNFSCIYFHNLDFDIKFLFDKLPTHYYKMEKIDGRIRYIPDEYQIEPISIGGKLAKLRLYKTYERNYFICRKCSTKIKRKNKKLKKKKNWKWDIPQDRKLICEHCKSDKETYIPIYTKTALEIRDSYLLLVSGAEKIGSTLRLYKGKIDYDNADLDEYIEYCKRDCEIVAYAIKKLIEFTNRQFEFENTDES